MRNATGRRRVRFVLLVMVAALTIRGAEGQAPWPLATAPHIIHLAKVAGLEDPGGLPDSQWLHLHRGHGAVTDGLHDVSLEVEGPRRLEYKPAPMAQIRGNQELCGAWVEGRYPGEPTCG